MSGKCTGKGGGGGGGADRDEHQDDRGVSRARKILLLIPVGISRRIEDHNTIGGASSPKPLHLHPSQVPPAAQVGGGKPTNIGTLKGHQGQHVTGRQSVRADGG